MNEVVECLSSAAYAQRPLAFTWEGQRHTVTAVLAEWRLPGKKCFRLRTLAGRLFDLTWDEGTRDWHIKPL